MIGSRLAKPVLLSAVLALTGSTGGSVAKPSQSDYLKKQEQLLMAELSQAEGNYRAGSGQAVDALRSALFRLANNYMQQGRLTDAESLLRRCLRLAAERGGSPSAQELHWLAVALLKSGKFQESERFLRQALEAQESWEKESKVAPESDSQLQGILSSLGIALMEQKKFSEAESVFKRNLGIVDRRKDAVSPISLPPALGDLAWLYARTGRASEAEPLFARAIALPPNAHALATQAEICEHYAECLRSQGKHSESERVLARARELRSRHGNLNPELDY